MKRKPIIIFALILVFVAIACVAVACGPTTAKDVTVTFDRMGVGENVQLSGKEGTDISADLPKPNSTQAYYFGGWYENDKFEGEAEELPARLPSQDKTYYARWYRKYDVDVMLEKADGTFEKSEELSFGGEINKGEDSVTLQFQTPSGYVDVNDSMTFAIGGRDSAFSLKYELKTVSLALEMNGEGENALIEAKRSTDITAKMPALTDTEDYFFGGWYSDAALTEKFENFVMPDEDATIYARWYRTYKVKAYVQNEAHTDYVFAEEKSFEANKGSENVTVKASAFDALANYVQPEDMQFEVSAKSDSVCELRFDRDDVTITYKLGEAGEDFSVFVPRGSEYTFALPSELDAELKANKGYRLDFFTLDGTTPVVSAKADANIEVKVSFIKALTERNGSDDKLYLKGNSAYLDREGVPELEGTYAEGTKMFSFENGEIKGRTYDDGTFATQRDGAVPFYLYDEIADEMNEDITLALDWLDGATLTVGQSGANVLSTYKDVDGVPELVTVPAGEYKNCTYRLDPDYGDYFVTVQLADGSVDLHFLFGEYESKDGKMHDVFVLRGIECGYYEDDMAVIFLDGYGEALYIIEDAYMVGQYGFYNSDEELGDVTEIGANFPTGSVYFLVEEFTAFEDGIPYQNIYRFDGLSGNFSEQNVFAEGGTAGYGELYLSGYGFVLLGNSSKKTRYDYEIQLGGMLMPYGMNWLKLYDAQTHAYVEDIFINSQFEYYFKMPAGAEFKFVVDFAMPSDLLYFEGNGKIHLFEYDLDFESLMYNKGMDGVVAEAGETEDGKKLYSVTFDTYPDDNFNYFELETDGIITCYREGTLVYNGNYKAADGSTLKLNGYGEAEYTGLDGILHVGRYYNLYGGLTFSCDDEECSVLFDFEIDGDAFGIIEYTDLPSDTLYHFVIMQDDSGQQYLSYNAVMTVEKNSGASIEIPITEEESIIVKGKISLADAIYSYFLFTVEDVSGTYPNSFVEALSKDFLFQLVGYNTQQGDMYGFALSDGFEKSYDLEDGSMLTLDGFGHATFKDADGNGSFGSYDVLHETTAVMGVQHIHYIFDFIDVYGNEMLFDLWDDGSLTKRGDEYSWYGYFIYDGVNIHNYLIFPDGNGTLDLVYYYEGMLYMATAKYTLDGNIGVMTDVEYTHWEVMDGFTQEECDILNLLAVWLQEQYEIYDGESYVFKLVKVGEEDCFMLLDENVKDVFVFDDLSVLKTDGFNEAVYTDKYGDSHKGTFVAEYYSADQGETLMTLIRFDSSSAGEMAFLITEESSIKVGFEFGNYKTEEDSVFLDGLGGITYTIGGETKEGKYVFDAATGIVTVTQDGDEFKIKVIVRESSRTFVICDESLAGVYTEVDMQDEAKEGGAELTMDGMGNAQIMENGVLTRYDVAHLELTVYRLTNILDEDDTIDVKLDLDANTFKRSDGVMLMEETQWFDFAGGGIVHTEVLMSIDSFYIVRLNGEVFGTLDSYEQFDTTSVLYYVTKADGSKTSYVRSLSGRFPNDSGYYGYAYMEYDEKSKITLNDSEGVGQPIVLTGYGLGDTDGKSYNYRTALYWFEGDTLCVAGIYDSITQGCKMYSVDYEAKTYTSFGDSDKSHFTVENGVLTAYTGKSIKIVIPKDMGITEIGEGVFSFATLGYYVRSINFSDVVEIVGKRAFYPEKASSVSADTVCEVLGTAKIKIVKEEAFYLADITSIELPAIELVEKKAFYGTAKLKSLALGNNAQSWSIGESAFGTGPRIEITITAPHAPLLGEKALNNANAKLSDDGSNVKYVKFTQATAWAEAQDAGTEVGQSWAQYFAETAVTYNLSGPDDAAGASLEAHSVDAYIEDKRK